MKRTPTGTAKAGMRRPSFGPAAAAIAALGALLLVAETASGLNPKVDQRQNVHTLVADADGDGLFRTKRDATDSDPRVKVSDLTSAFHLNNR